MVDEAEYVENSFEEVVGEGTGPGQEAARRMVRVRLRWVPLYN